jgi:Putative beta-barrel porin-2, OmpL-like. bbp2/Carboxypeptidase regulatory-like domain
MNEYKVVREMRRANRFPWTFARISVAPACTAFLLVALSLPSFPQAVVGVIGGVARDSATGAPVGEAQVVAHNLAHGISDNLGKGADHATVTSNDGAFTLINVEPGRYEVTATKNGFQKSLVQVEVAAQKTVRVELPLQGAIPEKSDDSPLTARERQLLERIERLEGRLAAMEAKEAGGTQAPYSSAFGTGTLVASLNPAVALPIITAVPTSAATPWPTTTAASGSAPAPAPAQGPAPAPAAAPAPTLPVALQAPDATPGVDNFTPFAFGDFTWLNGTPRNKDTVLDTKFFTPEVRFDTHFMEDFNQPIDHTIVGSTESFRSGEVQVEQISVGGDFHWDNVRGRILTMDGLFATTTPRNDASAGVGQWDLDDAYRYVSEAYGGYHFNVNHGLNVDAGIFVSYIGLFSYYNFDNWTYQPSYVSSNTPWFFNGVRVQWFPTNKLKIEPWLINGWQSYAKFNGHMGLGGQLLWMPKEWFKLVANQYGFGQDNLGLPKTERIHTDDSIEVRYYNKPSDGISKMAFSLTGDLGVQYGGGLCGTCGSTGNKEAFLGWMLYDRTWWRRDKFGLTLGGGQMSNPGRYLTLLPPIDGATAVSGTPYFTENPGQKAHMWDSTITLQYMPKEYITWWAETGYRHSDVPYFAGRGGVTPPGGNNGEPQYYTCASGATAGTASLAAAEQACGGGLSSVWFPDLRRSQVVLSVGVMVKF